MPPTRQLPSIGSSIAGWRGRAMGRAAQLTDAWRARFPALRLRGLNLSGLTLSRKMALFFGGLFAFALGLVMIGSHIGISLVADQILGREFAAESRVFASVREMRYDQMEQSAQLLAADFGFRSAVASGDAPTIESALDTLQRRIGVADAFLVRADGGIVGRDVKASRADLDYVVAAVNQDARRGVLRLDHQSYRAVAAPVNAPQLLGWVVFLAPLDGGEMAKLEALSAMPVHAQVMPVAMLDKDIPIVAAGSAAKIEKLKDGERVLVQASLVPGFGNARPEALVLEFSLTQALAAYAPMFRMLFSLCCLALAICIATSYYLARRLASPIELLGGAVAKVSRGEYAKVAIAGNDEIGVLAAAFNQMVDDIADRERQIERTEAEARATLEIQIREVRAENDRLNAIAAQQRSAVLAEAATALERELVPLLFAFEVEGSSLFNAARAMRSSLDTAKNRASEARLGAVRTERLTRDIEGSANNLAQSGEKIAEEARSTLQLVQGAIGDSAVAAESFADLGAIMSEIGSVTTEIRTISRRTNMLALNAAIEAAHAGLAGRSFAVVASEVKALAGQTAALTVAIGDRLAQVQCATHGVDSTIEQMRAALSAAGGVTAQIASAARAQSMATGNISESISDIAMDSRSAVMAIAQIDGAAIESTGMADRVQLSAEAVIERVATLRSTIDGFLAGLR